MLTLESILRTTRHLAAHGELAHAPVPRDRNAKPRSRGKEDVGDTLLPNDREDGGKPSGHG